MIPKSTSRASYALAVFAVAAWPFLPPSVAQFIPVNATSLQGVAISPTAPTNGEVLAYNSSSKRYEPATGTGGACDPAASVCAAEVTLTSMQLLDAANTQVTVVAGVTGKVIDLAAGVWFLKFGSVEYSVGSEPEYGVVFQDTGIMLGVPQGLSFDVASDRTGFISRQAVSGAAADTADRIGKALTFKVTSGSLAYGPLASGAINAAGTGYRVGDLSQVDGTCNSGGGTQDFTVTSVNGSGGITGLTLMGSSRCLISSGNSTSNIGNISASALASGGAGCPAATTFTVDGGNGDAAGVVDTDMGGVAQTYHLTNHGTSYTGMDGNATTASGGCTGLTLDVHAAEGSGATYNVNSVTGQGDGTLKIRVLYSVGAPPS